LGENLTVIAAQYEVTVEQLVEENGLEDANLIVENQSLCIPGRQRGSLSEWANYGVPGQGYDPNYVNRQDGYQGGYEDGGPSYGPQQAQQEGNGYNRPEVKPGDSYDPTYYKVPGKADESYVKPEHSKPETYWKDEKRYPQGGANFPEYVPRPDPEEEPEPDPEPDPDPNGENGENEENGLQIP
jgi:hypothetical protein